jgi:hypothetical protein
LFKDWSSLISLLPVSQICLPCVPHTSCFLGVTFLHHHSWLNLPRP